MHFPLFAIKIKFFYATGLFLYSAKTSEKQRLFILSGGIERDP